MAEWSISPLGKGHDRSGFACGHTSLDTFLRAYATQYEKRRLASTYVATEGDSTRVAGFFTLACGSLDASLLPEAMRKKLPKHPIPTIHLARLAVDLDYRGRRLGETLLLHAFGMALESAEKISAIGVDVWAIDDQAAAFYRKYGFTALVDDPHHLIISMKTIDETLVE